MQVNNGLSTKNKLYTVLMSCMTAVMLFTALVITITSLVAFKLVGIGLGTFGLIVGGFLVGHCYNYWIVWLSK
jgi:ABC-type spermidine/putrescine transport system permease subunit II